MQDVNYNRKLAVPTQVSQKSGGDINVPPIAANHGKRLSSLVEYN